MTERDSQLMRLYDEQRFEQQRRFYDRRGAEFERARDQGVVLAGVLMVFTAGAAALAAGKVGGDALKNLWSLLIIALPALSTALSAFVALYAFERHAKLYGDAADSLLRARIDAPTPEDNLSDAEFQKALAEHLARVEEIFRAEQGQWGQLVSAIRMVAPEEGSPKGGEEKP